jgi:hypothetical protein
MVRLLASFMEGRTSFCFVIGCGMVGVCIDIDHLFALFIPTVDGRAWHPALCVLCWFAFCGVIAFVAGLLVKLVLKRLISFNQDRLSE